MRGLPERPRLLTDLDPPRSAAGGSRAGARGARGARALEAEPNDTAARLNRGAIRARRGDYATARADFALAGDRHEARWNRAGLLVIEAVSASPGLPEAAILRRARAEAGEPSSYWSDHTVGRLLWTLLVERALAAGAWLAPPLAVAEAALRERRPGDALAAVRSVMERPDVRRYRVPCAVCGNGTAGVDSFEDAGPGA